METAAQTLSVLTWNIGRVHFGARVNGWLGHDSRGQDAAAEHVAHAVAASGAGVAVLQEISGAAQLSRILGVLGGAWRAELGPGATDRRVALFLRARAAGDAPAISTVELPGGRAGLSISNGRWAIAGVHLDAFDARARAAQGHALARWLDGRREAAVLVAGDLNLDLRFPFHSRRSDRAWWRSLVESRGLLDLGAHAGPTVLFGRRLDYVLARGVAPVETRVLRGLRVRLGDHDPLLARVSASR